MGLIAYLKDDKLKDLTSKEICIYLLLLDETETQWSFADSIATAVDQYPERVLPRLNRMKRLGYLMHKPYEEGIDNAAHAPIWICDPAHVCSDPEYLFSDFALI